MCCLPDPWFIPVVFLFLFFTLHYCTEAQIPLSPLPALALCMPASPLLESHCLFGLEWGVGKADSGLCVLVPTSPLCPVAPAWFINISGSWALPPHPPALLLGQKQQLLSTRQPPHQPDFHAPKSPLHSSWSFNCCVSADRARWNCLTSLGEEENYKKTKQYGFHEISFILQPSLYYCSHLNLSLQIFFFLSPCLVFSR